MLRAGHAPRHLQHLDLERLGLGVPALPSVRGCQAGGGVERVWMLLAVHAPTRLERPVLQLLGLGELALLAVRAREAGGGLKRGRVLLAHHSLARREHTGQHVGGLDQLARAPERVAEVVCRIQPVWVVPAPRAYPGHELAREAQTHGARVLLGARRACVPARVEPSLFAGGHLGLARDVGETTVAPARAAALDRLRVLPAVQADGAARRLHARAFVPAAAPVPFLARAVAVEGPLAPAAPALSYQVGRELPAAPRPRAELEGGGRGASVRGGIRGGSGVRVGARRVGRACCAARRCRGRGG